MALPIADRDLTASRLTMSEIKLILDFLVTNASGTSVNMVTGIGAIAPKFFTGLQVYLENRRDFTAGELAYNIAHPKSIQTDEYGNSSVILDTN